MKMSSEGGDTRFPDNLRVPAKVVTGCGHKKKGVETLGRVAVKINGKGQKLWVFPAAIHSGEPPPSPDARDGEVAPAGEVARAPKRQRRQPAAAAGAANDVVELQAKVTLGGQAVEASMALTPSALGFAEVEEVDCQFFRFLGTMLRDLGIERLSLQPSRRGTDAAATNLADLQALAASADGSDWLVTLLTALCGGDQLTGFVMAEMTKKTANRNRVNPLQSFVAGVLDAHQVPGNVRELVQRLRIAQTSESHRRAEVVITDKIAETFATITPRQGGLLVSKFDNLGYKKLGKDTSYVQYTMRLWKDFTEEEVAAVGVTKCTLAAICFSLTLAFSSI